MRFPSTGGPRIFHRSCGPSWGSPLPRVLGAQRLALILVEPARDQRLGPRQVLPDGRALPPVAKCSMSSKILSDARLRGEREEIGNEEICIIVGGGVGVGGDTVVARRSCPSSSSFRFRESRCWRLRWVGLHRLFFHHPSRGVRPRLGSFDDKVRNAGQAHRLSQRAGGDHVQDGQII
jgi:hypothetical protein